MKYLSDDLQFFATSDVKATRIKVLIAAPLKQKPAIFAEYQRALDQLEIPVGVSVDRFYIVNNDDEIIPYIRNAVYTVYNWKDKWDMSHDWNEQVIFEMEKMRNMCMEYAKLNNYDYLWFIDTDLLVAPPTLRRMLEINKDIIYEKHVTQNPDDAVWVSVYQRNNGDFYNMEECNRITFMKDELIEVGGGVGCTWMSRKVLDTENVNFSHIDNLTFDYIWGEDKYFGIRAKTAGFQIWADSYYPCTHLFSDRAFQRYKQGLDPIDWDAWRAFCERAHAHDVQPAVEEIIPEPEVVESIPTPDYEGADAVSEEEASRLAGEAIMAMMTAGEVPAQVAQPEPAPNVVQMDMTVETAEPEIVKPAQKRKKKAQ